MLSLDASGLHALEQLRKACVDKKITLIFAHVNEQPLKVMTKAGFVEKIGEASFQPHIDEALAYAQTITQ